MGEDPHYWGPLVVGTEIFAKNGGFITLSMGLRQRVAKPRHSHRDFLVVGQSQAWPCLWEAQKHKRRMFHVSGVTSDPSATSEALG